MKYMMTFIVAILLLASTTTLLGDQIVMIDPGHGGPGGGKYGENGDGAGTEGPNGLTEEWVNLQVALKLDTLFDDDYVTFPKFVGVLTREFDTTVVKLWDRVQKAKDFDATYFLSIHHNGNPENTLQGHEVYWSDSSLAEWWPWQQKFDWPDSTFMRSYAARDSLFAKKLLLRLHGEWGYGMRCTERTGDGSMVGCDVSQPFNPPLFVLNHVHDRYCALSEASYLTTYAEKTLFADEWSGHADEEALALYTGTRSFYNNAGIAQISNRFIGGPGETVGVDVLDYLTPVEFTWEIGEWHSLYAWQNFYHDDYVYSFHHWAHLEPGGSFPTETYNYRTWDVTVPWEYGYHIYRAYFTGGPYEASLFYLPYPLLYEIGEILPIYWSCDPGVDSTSRVSIYLDRYGGRHGFPETIATDIPFEEECFWTVTGPVSDSCLFKIVAEDVAGNVAEEIGVDMFTVSTCSWLVGDATGDKPSLPSDQTLADLTLEKTRTCHSQGLVFLHLCTFYPAITLTSPRLTADRVQRCTGVNS